MTRKTALKILVAYAATSLGSKHVSGKEVLNVADMPTPEQSFSKIHLYFDLDFLDDIYIVFKGKTKVINKEDLFNAL